MSIDRRMLIADDDSEVRLGAVELLRPLGLEIFEAESGDEALSILRRRQPLHLALLDLHMPGIDGLEVFRTMRTETVDVPCIFWSGDATEAIEQVVLRDGASAFLHKPVRPELLRSEVQRVLDDHWGRQQ
jgi:CheY-like chemotaxis protein